MNDRGNFFGPAGALYGNPLGHVGNLLGSQLVENPCLHDCGRHGIDANAIGGQLLAERLG